MKRICISVVNYNNENEVISFAEQLSNQLLCDITLVVTCNKVNDANKLKTALGALKILTKVVEPNENLGYLKGCLYGLSCLDDLSSFEWIVICNTDISFENQMFFSDLAGCNYKGDVWCVGPKIELTSNGHYQNPFFLRRPSKFYILSRKILFNNYNLYCLQTLLFRMKKRFLHKYSSQDNVGSQEVYAIHGSFFILRSDLIRALEEQDNPIFMYGEELLIAEIARENGKKSMVNYDLHVYHNENQTTGRVNSKIKQEWKSTSINYLYKNYFKNKRK